MNYKGKIGLSLRASAFISVLAQHGLPMADIYFLFLFWTLLEIGQTLVYMYKHIYIEARSSIFFTLGFSFQFSTCGNIQTF